MVKERELVTVEIDPESELAHALAAAVEKPIVLVVNGARFHVSRDESTPAADNDREAFREALRAVVGTLTPEEGERLKRDIYRWREEGTRPIDRP